MQSLDLTANRLRQLEPTLLSLAGLRRLCLRQNLLTSAAEVQELQSAPGERRGRQRRGFRYQPYSVQRPTAISSACCAVLEELELRDNQFVEVGGVA